jgi:hypothetical protein
LTDRSVFQNRHEGPLGGLNDRNIKGSLSDIHQRENLALHSREVDTDTTLLPRDSYVSVNTAAGDVDITLPYANTWRGRSVTVTIHNTGSTNYVIVFTQGTDTLVGSASILPGAVVEYVSNGVETWTELSSSASVGLYRRPTVFDYMSAAKIRIVRDKSYIADVSAELIDAFTDGVGYMPEGGYLCNSSVDVTLAVGVILLIEGDGSEATEIRFASGVNGIQVEYPDPVTPPSIEKITITTLDTGPTIDPTSAVYFYQNPAASYHWRVGPKIIDVVVRGANPALHGWSAGIGLENCWYPIVRDCTFKGYSASGAAQNSYESLEGIRLIKAMAPSITTSNFYHINKGIVESSSGTLCSEAVNIDKCEFVGCRTGIDLGSGTTVPQPATSITNCHFNTSYRGIILHSREQMSIHGNSFYRLDDTTEAWRGVELTDECKHIKITNSFFGNTNDFDTTSARGILITGDCEWNLVANASSDAWNAAGYLVEVAGTASNNIVLCRTFKNGNFGTSTWGNVTFTGTGTNNWLEDPTASITSFANADATPSVGNAISGFFQTANTGATTITDFDDGYTGQVFVLLINDANTTIQNDGTNIALRPGANFPAKNGDIITFRNYGSGLWREVTRLTSDARYANVTVSGEFTGAIGTTTPSTGKFTTLEATGLTTVNGQIKFPAVKNASADANTLDDYEEGTWTPTITAGAGTFTTVSASGRYVAIGRKVLWYAIVNITTNGTAAGFVQMTLPFTAAQNNLGYGRETVATGNMLAVTGGATTNTAIITKYDNTYPGGSGYQLEVQGHFEV